MTKLGEWLDQNKVGRSEFARRIDVTPGYVTRLCDDDDTVSPSLQVAALIARETNGAVTINDWVRAPSPSPEAAA